ncbi:hypothetical protein JCM17961_23370 [Endothiovibrio diazotrophicus]
MTDNGAAMQAEELSDQATIELPLDIGRDDGTLPPVETRP